MITSIISALIALISIVYLYKKLRKRKIRRGKKDASLIAKKPKKKLRFIQALTMAIKKRKEAMKELNVDEENIIKSQEAETEDTEEDLSLFKLDSLTKEDYRYENEDYKENNFKKLKKSQIFKYGNLKWNLIVKQQPTKDLKRKAAKERIHIIKCLFTKAASPDEKEEVESNSVTNLKSIKDCCNMLESKEDEEEENVKVMPNKENLAKIQEEEKLEKTKIFAVYDLKIKKKEEEKQFKAVKDLFGSLATKKEKPVKRNSLVRKGATKAIIDKDDLPFIFGDAVGGVATISNFRYYFWNAAGYYQLVKGHINIFNSGSQKKVSDMDLSIEFVPEKREEGMSGSEKTLKPGQSIVLKKKKSLSDLKLNYMGVYLIKIRVERLFKSIFNKELGTTLETNIYAANTMDNIKEFLELKEAGSKNLKEGEISDYDAYNKLVKIMLLNELLDLINAHKINYINDLNPKEETKKEKSLKEIVKDYIVKTFKSLDKKGKKNLAAILIGRKNRLKFYKVTDEIREKDLRKYLCHPFRYTEQINNDVMSNNLISKVMSSPDEDKGRFFALTLGIDFFSDDAFVGIENVIDMLYKQQLQTFDKNKKEEEGNEDYVIGTSLQNLFENIQKDPSSVEEEINEVKSQIDMEMVNKRLDKVSEEEKPEYDEQQKLLKHLRSLYSKKMVLGMSEESYECNMLQNVFYLIEHYIFQIKKEVNSKDYLIERGKIGKYLSRIYLIQKFFAKKFGEEASKTNAFFDLLDEETILIFEKGGFDLESLKKKGKKIIEQNDEKMLTKEEKKEASPNPNDKYPDYIKRVLKQLKNLK